MPRSSRNIFFSSSSSSEISCSIWAQITNTSQFSFEAHSLTAWTYLLLAPSSAKSSSVTLAANITGLAVRRLYSFASAASSSSSNSKFFASLPSSRCAISLLINSHSFAISLLLWAALLCFANLLSSISTSEKINSRLIVSISRIGSIEPSTWTILVSSKHLTTWTMASTSRMFARNWFPRPSPLEAPFTRPAISTNSITAGVIFAELYNAASLFNLSSGTVTTPTLGSIVQNG